MKATATSLALLAAPEDGFAAACCSGAGALPALMTTGDRSQLSATFSSGALIGDALAPGELAVFRAPSDSTQNTGLGLAYARAWSPDVQWGAQLTVRRLVADRDGPEGSRPAESVTALGDLQLSVAWEFLPELPYSPWRPRGFLWGGVSLPTGRSSQEGGNPDLTTGTGFWTPSLGAFFLQTSAQLDTSFLMEASFPLTGAEPVRPGPSVRALRSGQAGASRASPFGSESASPRACAWQALPACSHSFSGTQRLKRAVKSAKDWRGRPPTSIKPCSDLRGMPHSDER